MGSDGIHHLQKGQTTSPPTINFWIILPPTASVGYRAKKCFFLWEQLHSLHEADSNCGFPVETDRDEDLVEVSSDSYGPLSGSEFRFTQLHDSGQRSGFSTIKCKKCMHGFTFERVLEPLREHDLQALAVIAKLR